MHRRYLNFEAEAIALGLRASVLSTIFSVIFAIYAHQNLNFILAVIGVFISALIQIEGLKSSTSDQIKHGLALSLGAGITVTLGSIIAHHPLLLSLGLLIFVLPVGLSSESKPLTAITVLFIANLFIIGSGLPAPVTSAVIYGIYLCAGSLALVLSGYIQNILFKNKYDLLHNQITQTNKVFTLNTKNLKFALKLSIAVCAANAIAGYLRLPQQYCAPMTALLILRADHESSIKRINHRLFGTLIGSILAGCLIVVIHDKLILAVLMLPIMFLIVVSMAKHYGAYVFFLTVMVTILFNLIEFNGFMVVIERILFTLLGIGSVVTVVYLSKILPRILRNFTQ
jgi:hypothetical protein